MELAEMLARNAHAIWVHGKLKSGWVYKPKWLDAMEEASPTGSDAAPSSPLLVPYEQVRFQLNALRCGVRLS
jgi:hypothetical protein